MRVCVRIGLAVVALAMVVTSPAPAASEKPRPDALWEAFPLDPTDGRSTAPLLPPEQGRPEATAVTEVLQETSRPNAIVLTLGAAAVLALLAAIGVLSGRRLWGQRNQPSPSVPLWQGITWPLSSGGLQELQQSRAQTGSALVGPERHATEPHPDVPVTGYRWADQARARGSRRIASPRIRRIRSDAWRDDSAPALIGAAVAGIAALVFFYLVG